MYIATQLMSKKEKEELQKTFVALDKNADGKLSTEELITGYIQLLGNREQAEKEVKSIMEQADIDHNGFIDYSGKVRLLWIEFLLASTNKKLLLSKENLQRTFQLFDKV